MRLRKKTVLKIGVIIFAVVVIAIIAIHICEGVGTRHSTQFVEIAYYSDKLPPELDGYKIAFVTDLHDYDDPRLIKIKDEIKLWQPDLLLLGGDFCADPRKHLAIFSLDPPDGTYGVGGNHDDPAVLFPLMREFGMRPLDNEGVLPHEGFYLAGVADLRTQTPDTAKALQNAPNDAFVLLLSHNPALVMEHDVSRADLVLAGHTHGGQWNLFGRWSPALSIINPYGNRFRTGWAQGPDGTDVYVSNGLGSKNNLLRIFAPRQVIFLTLHNR